MRISVPGNILLLGEYAVLEDGGVGLAMAVERRVRISSEPSDGLSIEGAWQGARHLWTLSERSAIPIADAAVAVVGTWLEATGSMPRSWDRRILVDSSALFRADGRKSGLGSSAAVAVGLVCALLDAAGVPGGQRDSAAPGLALLAHRRAQGGGGSGYDVTCSFHGGMGIFHGGAFPSWEPCTLAWKPVVFLFNGPRPVSTADAVGRYARWKEEHPGEAAEFLEGSNRGVLGFVRARSAAEAARCFESCRQLGLALGDAIGVPSRIEPPPRPESSCCKSLGAGNELGACLLPEDDAARTDSGELERARVSEGGVRWEE
jgi:phosphomevalonate kinase